MVRTLTRCIAAAVLIMAHIPLPAVPGKHSASAGPMACCAPKSCCEAVHACTSGGGCGGAGNAGGVGLRMVAAGCGHETPRVTPLQLDPTVTPPVVAWTEAAPTTPELPASDVSLSSLATRPLVPPPRA